MSKTNYSHPQTDQALLDAFPEHVTVVHVITKLEMGGAQLNTLYTVEKLLKDRFEVFLIAGPGGLLDKRAAAIPGVKTIFVPELRNDINPLYSWKAFRRIAALLRDIKPHVVHTHSSKAGVVGRWAAWWAGVPIILHTIHGFAFSPYHAWWRNTLYVFMERITSTITTRFISVSRANIQEGLSTGILGQRDAVLIRSGVDLKLFAETRVDRAEKLRFLGVMDPAARIVTMAACLKPQKSPVDFVRVASHVHAMHPDVHFLLVGDGQLRGEVEEKVRQLGLADHFHLLGWRDDMHEIFAVTDIFLLTSLWEGLPQVYPQALAAGVPVVATDVDGADEIIHHGVNGYLVTPKHITKIAESVVLLLENETFRKRMSAEARKRLEDFDQDKMVEDQELFYLELMLRQAGKGQ